MAPEESTIKLWLIGKLPGAMLTALREHVRTFGFPDMLTQSGKHGTRRLYNRIMAHRGGEKGL